MVAVATAQARPASISGSALECGLMAKSLAIPTPHTALNSCPKITFLGCANGDSMAQNCKTAAAPYIWVREKKKKKKMRKYWSLVGKQGHCHLRNWQ